MVASRVLSSTGCGRRVINATGWLVTRERQISGRSQWVVRDDCGTVRFTADTLGAVSAWSRSLRLVSR